MAIMMRLGLSLEDRDALISAVENAESFEDLPEWVQPRIEEAETYRD